MLVTPVTVQTNVLLKAMQFLRKLYVVQLVIHLYFSLPEFGKRESNNNSLSILFSL